MKFSPIDTSFSLTPESRWCPLDPEHPRSELPPSSLRGRAWRHSALALATAALSLLFACGGTDTGAEQESDSLSALSDSSAERATSSSPVRLVWAFGTQCAPVAGCVSRQDLEGVVEVENIAYEKQVNLVVLDSTGTWRSVPAKFGTMLSGNRREVWDFKVPAEVSEFAIAYTVAGRTYWDNNHGRNYHLQRYTDDALVESYPAGGTLGYLLPSTAGESALDAWVFVQNRSYNKKVTIEYSFDGWSTTHKVDASYFGTYKSGIEAWKFHALIPKDFEEPGLKVETRTIYTWDSGSVVDDNFGRNYAFEGR